MPRLIISAPDGKRGILELTKPVLTIGRGNANDLVLNDSSVSRFHAVVKQLADGSVLIADRGSTNGVLLEGERLRGEHRLQPADRVRLGVYELRLERVEDASLIVRRAALPDLDQVLQAGRGARPAQGSGTELTVQLKRLERENYLLRLLYDAGKTLHSRLSLEEIADQTVELAFRIEGVERGFVMLLDDEGQVSRQTEVRYRRPAAPEPDTNAVPQTNRSSSSGSDQPDIILSRAMLDRLRTEMEPILITDVRCDARFQGSDSVKLSGLRSAMCAPLLAAGQWDARTSRFSGRRLFGILYVDNFDRAAAFTEEELDVFAVVASQAAAAMTTLQAHTQLAEAAVQRHALERFVAPEVVEMIAARPHEIQLGGRNQAVTVLFADIRGFTAIAERLAPQKIVELLNEFFTRVTDVIFDHGGTLDKYLGDGVLAVFGAPISKGNDALTAVRAAVAIQELMRELNRDAAARDWPELQVGIGVNSGEVTAGNIGSPRRLEYTVVGDAVNVAARLMGHATSGQILTTGATITLLGNAFPVTALPPLLVKGRSEPLSVYAVNWTQDRPPAGAIPR